MLLGLLRLFIKFMSWIDRYLASDQAMRNRPTVQYSVVTPAMRPSDSECLRRVQVVRLCSQRAQVSIAAAVEHLTLHYQVRSASTSSVY